MVQPDPIVTMPLRVRYHECDQQGVVFNAHYLSYADMASFEAVNTLFGSYAALTDRGLDMVVAESNVRYRAGCRFDDDLVVECFTEKVGNTSWTVRFDMRRAGELVNQVVNRYVWVDAQTMRPVTPPEDVRAALARSGSGLTA
ncbi:MAG TPA: thioesterase family protein [Mycobacterium sp.]|nr:thioesterase family protein [Mycobacterium sp.]